jgi:hypothetical protein
VQAISHQYAEKIVLEIIRQPPADGRKKKKKVDDEAMKDVLERYIFSIGNILLADMHIAAA